MKIYPGFCFSEYLFNTRCMKMKNKINVITAHNVKETARNGVVRVSISKAKNAILNKCFISNIINAV
jgi:hypothetical protein